MLRACRGRWHRHHLPGVPAAPQGRNCFQELQWRALFLGKICRRGFNLLMVSVSPQICAFALGRSESPEAGLCGSVAPGRALLGRLSSGLPEQEWEPCPSCQGLENQMAGPNNRLVLAILGLLVPPGLVSLARSSLFLTSTAGVSCRRERTLPPALTACSRTAGRHRLWPILCDLRRRYADSPVA